MAKRKSHEEPQEISGQEITKYMFIAIAAIIAVGLLIAGGLELYFTIAKGETIKAQEPVIEAVETVEIAPEVPVIDENLTAQNVTEQVNETIETAQNVIQTETINQSNQTNQSMTLEVTNTAQNTTNTSQVISYNFDQLTIKFPNTLNLIQAGKSTYHYVNITEADGTPVLNSEGFDVEVLAKIGNGQPSEIPPQSEKGQWLIGLYLTPAGTHYLTVTVKCKNGVNYCSRAYSGTSKTAQQQFIVS